MTRYSVTKRIYLGKRKDCNSVGADRVNHVCKPNWTKLKEELAEGKKLRGGAVITIELIVNIDFFL